MDWLLLVMAGLFEVVGVIGLTVFGGELAPLLGLTAFFVTLWLISAELFRWAGEAERG